MHLCPDEFNVIAWILAGIGTASGYLIARARCWWTHIRKRCPNCGIGRIVTTNVRMRWNYGDAKKPNLQIPISAVVPVNTCRACEFRYEDYRAERIREAATTDHLKRHKD